MCLITTKIRFQFNNSLLKIEVIALNPIQLKAIYNVVDKF